MTKISLSIALAATLMATAGSALALPAAEQVTTSLGVSYADLNLANSQDAKVMVSRIEHAARQVCEPRPASFAEYPDWRSCISKATSGAISSLNAPMVTAAYSGKPVNGVSLAENSAR